MFLCFFFIQEDLHQNDDLQNTMSQMRSINDNVCLYERPPLTLELKVKVILQCINQKTDLVKFRLQFENSFQIAYDELFFDSVDRDDSKAWNNIKKVFVHVQAAFCHASLGTKIHVNYGNTAMLLNDLRDEFSFGEDYANNAIKPILKPLTQAEMEKDSNLNLMIYLTNGIGSGVAFGQPCGTMNHRFSVNQCGDTDNVFGMLTCVAVCILPCLCQIFK